MQVGSGCQKKFFGGVAFKSNWREGARTSDVKMSRVAPEVLTWHIFGVALLHIAARAVTHSNVRVKYANANFRAFFFGGRVRH